MTIPTRAAAGVFLSVSLVACRDEAAPLLPAQLRVTEGDRQIAQVGTLLPVPIVAMVLDADGHPAKGVSVEWRGDGDGRLLPLDDATDERGEVRARWQLGASAGRHQAEATLPGLEPAVFTAIAEGRDVLPFGRLIPLDFATYEGSRQVVHPDYAVTPSDAFGSPYHLAITPYPFGDAHYENPSFFDGERWDTWDLGAGATNPVVLPDAGHLSDPDLVYVPELGELWLYYRQVTVDNVILLVRTRNGHSWSTPVEVVRAPNHQIVSPSVVRRAERDWWMFAVNSGATGCSAPSTTIAVRRSSDGLTWGAPMTASLAQPGLWAWHIDVQWIPSRSVFWAVYNAKSEGGCTTPAVYIASSSDGLTRHMLPGPVLAKGVIPELQDIVYRTTFQYDPLTDAITFWYSGARYEEGRYRWGAAVERRPRTDVFDATRAGIQPGALPPAPAPLTDWP